VGFFERFIEKLNTLTAVAVMLAFIVVVNGFLFYYFRYQPALQSPADVDGVAPTVEEVVTTAGTTTLENPRGQTEATAEFVHTAASQNIVSNSTYIEDPSTLENPDAILLAEWVSGPGANAAGNSPTGVWYDANRGGRWAVFNQDLAPMAEGTTFDVRVWAKPGGDVFVHRATPEDVEGNETYVDHPSLNGNPDAVFSLTPNWNPGGGAGTYVNAPVGTRYDAGEEKWAILREDLGPMPEGAAFNIVVTEGAAPE
jgi:hypothetical protein